VWGALSPLLIFHSSLLLSIIFVSFLPGLNPEQMLQKMRVLSFVQLAEAKSEISFDVVQQELQLGVDEVEPFIIDGMFTFKVLHLLRVCIDGYI